MLKLISRLLIPLTAASLSLATTTSSATVNILKTLNPKPSQQTTNTLDRLNRLPLAQRLDSLDLLYGASEDLPLDDQFAIINALMVTADAAHNNTISSYARHDLLIVLYNEGRYNDFLALIDDAMTDINRLGCSVDYYNLAGVKGSYLLETRQIHQLLALADSLNTRAKKQHDDFGQARVAIMVGETHAALDDANRACQYFRRALNIINSSPKIDSATVCQLAKRIYITYAETAFGLPTLDTVISVCHQWLNFSAKWANPFGSKCESNMTFFRKGDASANLFLANAYIQLSQLDSARTHLDRADNNVTRADNDLLCQYKLYSAELLLAQGHPHKALTLADSVANTFFQQSNISSAYTALAVKRDALTQLGRFAEAAALTDSIRINDNRSASDALSGIMTIAEHHRDNATTRLNYLHLLIIAASALLILLLVATIHNILLLRKNKRLYLSISQANEQEADAEKSLAAQPTEKLSPEARLYVKLCAAMTNEKLYTDPDLSRETLANHLATNYQYVANAIRQCANGMTVSAFINKYRLREAADILASTDMPIQEVAETVGFNSRSTFLRAFSDTYKMTPRDFRKAAQQDTI